MDFSRIWAWARLHTVWSTVIAIIVLGGAWYGYGILTAPSTAPVYYTTTVATGTVVAALTETGQVSASQQISLSPKASGTVVGIYVKPGNKVYAGELIAQLDATDAAQALRNAELSLQNAEITYQETTATSTLALTLLQAQNGVTNAQLSLQKTHDATYASIASTFADISSLTSSIDSVLHGSNVAGHTNQKNIDAYGDIVSSHDASIAIYQTSAENSYTAAVAAYNAAIVDYKATSLSATDDQLVALAQETYQVSQASAQAVKDAHDFFDRVNNDYTLYNLTGSATELTSLLATTNSDSITVSNDLSSMLSNQSNIISAEQTLAQAQDTLGQAQGGSSSLTLQQAALALQQAKDAVTTAQETLANYAVVAPFAGTVASVGVQTYDQAGSGTAVATLVTNQETVDITVNEVDAAKIIVGQKATITFDALPNVSIAGTVSSVNTIGTVSSGVVSYSGVITFDTPNASVLPGMSATADIITGTETGLMVPSSAVKASGSQSYVSTFTPPLVGSSPSVGVASSIMPARTIVTTGLTDNTNVIIESGLTAGAQVGTRTAAGTTATTISSAAQSTSILGGSTRTGIGGGGGGALRVLTP